MHSEKIDKINKFVFEARHYSDQVIEASLIEYVKEKSKQDFYYNGTLKDYQGKSNENLLSLFEVYEFPLNIEFLIEFFEALLKDDNILENGIVFTPEYITKYIFERVYRPELEQIPDVIDPGCGCGIFLSTAAKIIKKSTGMPYSRIISEHIFGIELDSDNARRCKIVLNLLPLIEGESNKDVFPNILCQDSLKCKWAEVFGVKAFDLIIGNPPYVNTHNMSKETTRFLKKTFSTTKSGVYNIFYAFIEYAFQFLKSDGMLSYIVPNNFLTIKSATNLRKFIMETKSLHQILDFGNNMVFKPVRTYNCIIQLTKSENKQFNYFVMDQTDNIENKLKTIEFETMPIDKLDVNGWKLVDKKTRKNLQIIENQMMQIKKLIRTGIATLRDKVFIVEKDENGFFKSINGKRYPIDAEIVKRLYKIPELKCNRDLQSICRYIIFPYTKGKSGFEIISENDLKEKFSKTYEYLVTQKSTLDERDKGKPNPVAWYAYGRTQGLNKYGKKLLFPTFAAKPRFIYVDDEYALFCNGYAVFEDEYFELDLLQKILNSKIMEYYVKNTSYTIEGGYYCYQKKYIERFSVPYLDSTEKETIRKLSGEKLDQYLISVYGIDL